MVQAVLSLRSTWPPPVPDDGLQSYRPRCLGGTGSTSTPFMRFRSAARRRISPRAGKAKRGIATPKQELDLVRRRLQVRRTALP